MQLWTKWTLLFLFTGVLITSLNITSLNTQIFHMHM